MMWLIHHILIVDTMVHCPDSPNRPRQILISSASGNVGGWWLSDELFSWNFPQQKRAVVYKVTPPSPGDCCCCCRLVNKSCLTLCDPTDCSLPGSSVHGISQTKLLEWVAISFSRGSSQSRDRTHISCLASGFFTTEYTVGNILNFYLIENFVPFKLVANRN